jgi:histidine triad (HIT) family protein
MNKECIFCKIIAKDIPSHIVCEDESVMAFLDIHPINHGMTLVVPKAHIDFVHHTNEALFHQLMSVSKKVMVALEKAFTPSRVGLIIEGFDINHAHIKITPLHNPSDIYTVHVENSQPSDFDETLEKVTQFLER